MSEQDIFYQIMNDVLKREKEANKEKYVGKTKSIRIHPKSFNDLRASEKFVQSWYTQNDPYSITGIPLEVTTDVEKWEIII